MAAARGTPPAARRTPPLAGRMPLALLLACSLLLAACAGRPGAEASPPPASTVAADRGAIRFGVGPVLPTPEETRTAFEPFFAHLAGQLGYSSFDLQEATEWAGIGVALASEQVDVAWLGPWGYVLARDTNPGVEAVATVRYDGSPTYTALIVTGGDNAGASFPRDARGTRLTLADTGSTSGWLIPTFMMKAHWDIDPATYFSEFSEGGTHAANVIAVVEGNVDYASDFDRHLNAMIAEGRIGEDDVAIAWRSDPLPGDAIAVRPGLDPGVVDALGELLTAMPPAEAAALLPDPYDGFVPPDDEGYAFVERAGVAVGRLDR